MVELDPAWRPLNRAPRFRFRQVVVGLMAATTTAVNLTGLGLLVYLVATTPSGWWTGLKLLVFTLLLAITLRHQWATVVHGIHQPALFPTLGCSLSLAAASLLAGLACWAIAPLRGAVGGMAIAATAWAFVAGLVLVATPMVLADVMMNIQTRWLGATAFENALMTADLARQRPPPRTGGPEIDVAQLIRAIHHTWNTRYMQQATLLKSGLFLVVRHQLRPQVLLYAQRLLELYERDLNGGGFTRG